MTEAAGPGGVVDLAKFPSFNELNTKLMGRRTFPGQTHLNTNAHHLVRKDLVNAFFQNTTEAQRNKMPSVLLPVDRIHEFSHGKFEEILRGLLPVKKNGYPATHQQRDEILILLEQAYSDFGRPELFPIARQWLMGPMP